jgi:hypothetical protein
MKYKKICIFILGILLTLFGLLYELLQIADALEGYPDEDTKIGAIVVGFLMIPVTLSGVYLIINNRPKRKTKFIKIIKILEILQKKKQYIYKHDLTSYFNLSDKEADRLLKEMTKIGLLKVNKRIYNNDQYLISDAKVQDIINNKKSIWYLIKDLMSSMGKIRIIASIFFILCSIVVIILGTNECCSVDGFYYLIFFSTLSILCSWYLIRNKKNKQRIPDYIEIVSEVKNYH